jgi:dipeptidase E
MAARPRQGQIIALGGGGFSMEPENPALDSYTLACTRKLRPRVCFLPTASGDAESYIARFFAAFPPDRARADVLRMFDRERRTPRKIIESADVIYVGGGNTVNAMTLWRYHGVDEYLRRFWEAGGVLTGLSAGMICWFGSSITDSFGPLQPLRDGLRFLRGSACPHYDGEPGRRPAYHRAVREGLPGGYAADDGAGLHFVGTKLAACVASRPGPTVYRVRRVGGRVVEEPQEMTCLTPSGDAAPITADRTSAAPARTRARGSAGS